MTRKYCKAYYLKDLREFPQWSEEHDRHEPELIDDSVVYLWDDFTVVRSPIIADKGIVFDKVTSDWQNFCRASLKFEIPGDLHFAYEQDKDENITSSSTEVEQSTTRE